MPNHMDRGPHTGLEPGTLASDMTPAQLKSVLSNFDFDELLRIQLPPASGIRNAAVFDLQDLLPVGASSKPFASRFNGKPEQLRVLADIFSASSAPAGTVPREASEGLPLGGATYTVSGPRGGQFPLEVAVLHGKKDGGGGDGDGEDDVLFASVTASVLVLVQADPAVADAQQRARADSAEAASVAREKDTVWTSIRSFTQALTSRGL
ncbi:hypothetical protein OC834_000599 [Tilletia horrida]|nr:hypothetical protein OC834_000599 [Tilletia horrida]